MAHLINKQTGKGDRSTRSPLSIPTSAMSVPPRSPRLRLPCGGVRALALREASRVVREHDLHTAVLLPSRRGIVGRYREPLAESLDLQAIQRDAPHLQCIRDRLGTPLREVLVVRLRTNTVGETFDLHPRVGIV